MIEIVTLFLGLATGPQPVELTVGAGAAAVEVLLDGQPVARLDTPPWRLEVDLGEALMPHELVAVARDEAGSELARARRWINIDMPRVEIGGRAPPGGLTPLPMLFENGQDPAADEMAGWFLADGAALTVRAVHAGAAEVIVVQDPAARRSMEELARVYLAYQLDRLGFPADSPRADSAAWNPELPAMSEDEFRQAAAEVFRRPGDVPESRQIGQLWQAYHRLADLGDDTTVRFISPLAAPISRSEGQRNLFMRSPGVPGVGLFWLAEKLRPMSFAYRFADAVAIAGREVHAAGRRRAVLLLLHGKVRDDSLHTAAAVRDYLRALRVPLFVWSLSPTADLAGWGRPRLVGFPDPGKPRSIRVGATGASFHRFATAATDLRRAVDGQRIVWLRGQRLPHRVELTDEAVGARPAGLESPTGSAASDRRRGRAASAAAR